MKSFKEFSRKLWLGLLVVALLDPLALAGGEGTRRLKGGSQEDLSALLKDSRSQEGVLPRSPGICSSCGCGPPGVSGLGASFESYFCGGCSAEGPELRDCILKGVSAESAQDPVRALGGTGPQGREEYLTLLFGSSDRLVNMRTRTSVLSKIFEPEFAWERFSHGSMRDNCRLYGSDSEPGSGYFKLRYFYTLEAGANCTEVLLHFVDKNAGSTVSKNLRLSKELNWTDGSGILVLQHEDVRADSRHFDRINLHREFNLTYYDLPPTFLFSRERREWVPAGVQGPQIEVNPKMVSDNLVLLLQPLGPRGPESPVCELKDIRVQVAIQCSSAAFPPSPLFSRSQTEARLREMRSRSGKKFELLARRVEQRLLAALESIPNAWLSPRGARDSQVRSPLSGLSVPCKEALYLNEVPRLMSRFNRTSLLLDAARPLRYIEQTLVLEDAEENALLGKMESALDAA
ncbi:hypothetical protein HWI79_3481 [Cryptosporidium felis]|nr:hypothetical protein HWI79_3481 [Cryptosporidium felis]